MRFRAASPVSQTTLLAASYSSPRTLEGNQSTDILDGGPGADFADGGVDIDQCTAETTVRCE